MKFSRDCSRIPPLGAGSTSSPLSKSPGTAFALNALARPGRGAHRNNVVQAAPASSTETRVASIQSYANIRCHLDLLLRCLTPESVTRKGGHGGATECGGNGAPSLCCGWRGSGELGPVGRRPGLDAMDLARAGRCGPCTRHHRLLSAARIVCDE